MGLVRLPGSILRELGLTGRTRNVVADTDMNRLPLTTDAFQLNAFGTDQHKKKLTAQAAAHPEREAVTVVDLLKESLLVAPNKAQLSNSK